MTKHTQDTSAPTTTASHDQKQLAAHRETNDAAARAGALRGIGSFAGEPASSAGMLTTLQNLDRYLAAADHDADHPWRKEIAASLSAAATTAEVTGDCIDNIDNAVETLDGLLRLALQECKEAGRDEKVGAAIRAARRYVGDISDYSNCLGWSAA